MSISDIPRSADDLLPGLAVLPSATECDAVCGAITRSKTHTVSYIDSLVPVPQLLAQLRGQTATRVAEAVERELLPGARRFRDDLSDAEQAVQAFRDAVAQLRAQREDAHRSVDTELEGLRSCEREIAEIAAALGVTLWCSWRDGPAAVLPDPQLAAMAARPGGAAHTEIPAPVLTQMLRTQYEMPWQAAALRWRGCVARLTQAETQWGSFDAQLRRAERALSAALTITRVGKYLQLTAAAPGEQQLQRVARGFAATSLAEAALFGARVTSVSSAPVPAEMLRVRELLALTPQGAALWSAQHIADPNTIAARWQQLDTAEREWLLHNRPEILGNAPGIPFAVRDRANRSVIVWYQQHPESLSDAQLAVIAELSTLIAQPVDAPSGVQGASGAPDAPGAADWHIVVCDLSAEVPLVAIAYGDLDQASFISWMVPGMQNDAAEALHGWRTITQNVYQAQQHVAGVNGAHAVVAWLGYDTPDTFGNNSVLLNRAATTGGVMLAAELDGVAATRSWVNRPDPHLSVIAHSYGTTVASYALTLTREDIDSAVFLGSAGIDPQLVTDLNNMHLRRNPDGEPQLYVARAPGDTLASIGALFSGRVQPQVSFSQFGQQEYNRGMSFPVDGSGVGAQFATDGHSLLGEGTQAAPFGVAASKGHGYLDRNTQSLASVAQLSLGLVTPALAKKLRRERVPKKTARERINEAVSVR